MIIKVKSGVTERVKIAYKMLLKGVALPSFRINPAHSVLIRKK